MSSINIEDLRAHLMGTLDDLRNRDRPMEVDRALAIAKVATVLVDTARVEVDYIKATSKDDSAFLEKKTDQPVVPGVLGSTVHKLR